MLTLENLLNVWAPAFAREHGSKKGIKWVEWTEDGLSRHNESEAHSLLGKKYHLSVKEPTSAELIVVNTERLDSNRLIWNKTIINKQPTEQSSRINLREKWAREHKLQVTQSREIELALEFAASIPFVDIKASISATFTRTDEDARTNAHERETDEDISVTVPARTKLKFTITNVFQKTRSQLRCPMELTGFVVIYSRSEVTYEGPYDEDVPHKLCIVPIVQVFGDLARYAQVEDLHLAKPTEEVNDKKWLTIRERDLLREWHDEPNRFRCEKGKVFTLLDYTVEDSVYLNSDHEFVPEALVSDATIIPSSVFHSSPPPPALLAPERMVGEEDILDEVRFGEMAVSAGGTGISDIGDSRQRQQLFEDAKKLPKSKVLNLQPTTVSGRQSLALSGDAERLARLGIIQEAMRRGTASNPTESLSTQSTTPLTTDDAVTAGTPGPNV